MSESSCADSPNGTSEDAPVYWSYERQKVVEAGGVVRFFVCFFLLNLVVASAACCNLCKHPEQKYILVPLQFLRNMNPVQVNLVETSSLKKHSSYFVCVMCEHTFNHACY